jgi:outer membrane protein TolC
LLFATNEQGVAGRTLDGNVSATLTWRLFDGGLRYADLASRRADVREAEYRAEDARTRVRQEVRGARISLDEARATLELAELRTRVAEQNAEEVRALFASGLAGALEQVDAAVAEYEARASLARQKVAVRVAELSVLAALGSWPGERINP